MSQAPNNVEINAAHDGSSTGSASINVGDSISIRLKENPTTGFKWEVTSTPDLLSATGSQYYPPISQLAGAGGERTFTFKGTKAGQGAAVLSYRRSWEADKPAAKTYTLTVTVS